MIKAHNITLTIFVFIYIPPIYIFWKSSPLPQSIVYFISTHTIKSHNKIIPKSTPKSPTILPQNHSNPTNKSHTPPNHPFHPNNTTPLLQIKSPSYTHTPISNIITLSRPHIQHLHTPNNLLLTRIFPLHNTINITHYT